MSTRQIRWQGEWIIRHFSLWTNSDFHGSKVFSVWHDGKLNERDLDWNPFKRRKTVYSCWIRFFLTVRKIPMYSLRFCLKLSKKWSLFVEKKKFQIYWIFFFFRKEYTFLFETLPGFFLSGTVMFSLAFLWGIISWFFFNPTNDRSIKVLFFWHSINHFFFIVFGGSRFEISFQ